MSAATESTRGEGWVAFAGVMIFVSGVLNLFDGIGAVSDSHFLNGAAQFLVSNLHTWGWVHIILGGLLMLVGGGIMAGSEFMRWMGVVIASINMVTQLVFINAYPFWSLAIFSLDVLVIYGLVAYGGRRTART